MQDDVAPAQRDSIQQHRPVRITEAAVKGGSQIQASIVGLCVREGSGQVKGNLPRVALGCWGVLSLQQPCTHACSPSVQTCLHLSLPQMTSWAPPAVNSHPVCPRGTQEPPPGVGALPRLLTYLPPTPSQPGHCIWAPAHLGMASLGSSRVQPGHRLPHLSRGLRLRSLRPGLWLWGSGSPGNKEMGGGGLTTERYVVIQRQCLGFRRPWDPDPRRARDPLVLRHQGDQQSISWKRQACVAWLSCPAHPEWSSRAQGSDQTLGRDCTVLVVSVV